MKRETARRKIRKAVGVSIRTIRDRKGLSQERLALAAGIDRSHMGRIERGSAGVNIETLWRVLQPLEARMAEWGEEFDK